MLPSLPRVPKTRRLLLTYTPLCCSRQNHHFRSLTIINFNAVHNVLSSLNTLEALTKADRTSVVYIVYNNCHYAEILYYYNIMTNGGPDECCPRYLHCDRVVALLVCPQDQRTTRLLFYYQLLTGLFYPSLIGAFGCV